MKLLRVSMMGALVLLVASSLAHGQGGAWGDVKGQVVWAGEKAPAPIKLDLGNNPDKKACLAKGPLLDPKLTVDPKTKGVRWVMVWLADKNKPKDPLATIPVHPALKAIKDKEVIVDQPCCLYEPYVFGIREGQILVAKNSSAIAHNVKIEGGSKNQSLNISLPPGQKVDVKPWKAIGSGAPVQISCSIHGWMQAWVRVFNHPYFAVTNAEGEFEFKNAPAGTFRLIIWHPEQGWINGNGEGKEITIKAGGVTDLKKIEVKDKP